MKAQGVRVRRKVENHCSTRFLHIPCRIIFMCYCINYKLSALQVSIWEQNTLTVTTEQFTTVKTSGRAYISSNSSSQELKVFGWNGAHLGLPG